MVESLLAFHGHEPTDDEEHDIKVICGAMIQAEYYLGQRAWLDAHRKTE